jgi:hypothetical protein
VYREILQTGLRKGRWNGWLRRHEPFSANSTVGVYELRALNGEPEDTVSLSCNKRKREKKGFSGEDIAVLYGDSIEDFLSGLDGIELDPRDAMDLSELVAAVNVEREKLGQELVALPPAIHLQINGYAEKGMYHGMGRKYPRRRSFFEEKLLELMADEFKKRKEELEKSGTVRNKLDASLEAADEIAAEMRVHGFKRSAETVLREISKRRIFSRD